MLASRLRELAFLNAGLVIRLRDERGEAGPVEDVYEYKGGIREFVELLNKTKEPVHEDVIAFIADVPLGSGSSLVARGRVQWTRRYTEQIICYTNNIHNSDGGTHLTGLRTALTKTLNTYGQDQNLFKDVKNGLTGDDTREGLTCVIHVKHPDASLRLADEEQARLQRGQGHRGDGRQRARWRVSWKSTRRWAARSSTRW